MATDKIRVAVLISGGGRTLRNFIELADKGELPIDITLVISSVEGVKGTDYAEAAGIATKVIARKGMDAATFNRQITEAIDAAGADLVCLAGFLSMWEIPPQYENKVMNIHPALLPKYGGKGYYGHHVHEAVLAAGEKESGCTVHFANNEYDAGPIILQKKVPVMPDDTPDALAARVFEQECIAYPEAIRLFAERRLIVKNGQVEIQ
jgi:formyltetrahydrofolate-dependent phosphoribosylglycinamide formyltransferase